VTDHQQIKQMKKSCALNVFLQSGTSKIQTIMQKVGVPKSTVHEIHPQTALILKSVSKLGPRAADRLANTTHMGNYL
jgi:hypothetical protein